MIVNGQKKGQQTDDFEKLLDEEMKEDHIARRRAAADRIIARRPKLPPDFDEKQELLDYLDERYGV